MGAALAVSLVATMPTASYAWYCPPKVVPVPGQHFSGGGAAPWIVIGCAGGIILAALAANYRDHRELTAQEAWSCGLGFLASVPVTGKAMGSNAPVRAKG